MNIINRFINSLALTIALIMCCTLNCVLAENSVQHSFVLPTQRLASSLIAISKQAQLPIIFYSQLTEDKMAPAFEKTTTVDQALTELLVGSGLFFSVIDNSFIVITEHATNNQGNELTLEQIRQLSLEQINIYGYVLTGSRLARTDFQGSAPVDVLRQPDLELRGSVTIGEKLKFLPAVSGNPTSTAVNNGGDGSATVTLRGLPASNTLVLINGRRIASDGLEGDAIDLNSIAPAAIDRVEILKDGASAIYGADAIAGVVNLVMKDNFDGLLLNTFYGESSRDDNQTTNTSLLFGRNFSRASIFVALTTFEQNGIFSRDRKQSENADGRSWGGIDARSSATPAARITLPSTQTVILDQDQNGNYLNAGDPNNFRAATSEDLYNYSEKTTAFVPHEHNSFYSSVQLDLNDQLGFFVETSFDTTHSHAQSASTPFTSAFEAKPITVSANNIYNPFGVDISDIRRRMVEMPVRYQDNTSTAQRLTSGFKGVYNRWSWEALYTWSRNNAEELKANLLDVDKLEAALGPAAQCINDCVALNLFGAPGSISADQIAYIMTNSKSKGISKLTTWSLNTVGTLITLPSGAIELATGIEHRKESTRKFPILTPGQGLTIGGSNFSDTSGSRSVTDAYFETNLPLIKGDKWIKHLNLDLSARHSHYSDFGDTTNPKIGLALKPSRDLLLRTTWSKGFRAPSLNELYKVATESQSRLLDPCSLEKNVGVLPGCTQKTDSTRSQYLTLFNGNQALQPERSTNRTMGLVWSPQFLPHFLSSLDLFQIKQNNVVAANAQYIIDINAQTGEYSNLVFRNTKGEIQKIIAQNLNVGKRNVEGLDFTARYQRSSAAINYALAINASHIHAYQVQASKFTRTEDVAGTFVDTATDGLGAIPKWKANISLMWKSKTWQSAYTVHFVDSLNEVIPNDNQRERKINSWSTHDFQLGYKFNQSDGVQLVAGIDNIFDAAPPRVASGFNDNLDARTHELKGRFFYLKLSQQFQ